jgi:hypothetical protein
MQFRAGQGSSGELHRGGRDMPLLLHADCLPHQVSFSIGASVICPSDCMHLDVHAAFDAHHQWQSTPIISGNHAP